MAEYGQTWEEEAQIQIEILERMFDDESLGRLRSRTPAHPAIQTYDHLAALVGASGFRWEDSRDVARSIATMLFDRSTWAWRPGSDNFWLLIDDERARDQMSRRIWNSDAFGDVLAELFYFGWLSTEGFFVQLVEHEGFPDLCLQLESGSLWAEVKRIRLGTKPARVRKILTKANQQIKAADAAGVGIVFVSLTRPAGAGGSDDRVPADVQSYVDQVERQLASGYIKSVAQVIVTWDDWLEPVVTVDAAVYFLRRRSIVMHHRKPRQKLRLPDGAMNVGLTAAVSTRRRN